MPFSQQYRGTSNPNDKAVELLRKNKDSLTNDLKKSSSNPNDKAIMINIKQLSYNYNQYKLLNMIYIIHKRRVLIHIKKFMIWMI
jgi:hypothetical protein